jgi:hypothetical protein
VVWRTWWERKDGGARNVEERKKGGGWGRGNNWVGQVVVGFAKIRTDFGETHLSTAFYLVLEIIAIMTFKEVSKTMNLIPQILGQRILAERVLDIKSK